MTNQKPKIFLSYAHEDIGMAKRIYQDLKRYGLDVWFDNESLLGGQNWKFEINKAIKESTYFLAVLSKESIDSIGYVQKELKIALEMLDLYPKNKTYILPVRIENCEPIEERLSDLHWIDVFPENEYQSGLKKILQVVSPSASLLRVIIRNKPKNLSHFEVHERIVLYGFYDIHLNPKGIGISHQYKVRTIKGEKVVSDEVTGLMWQQSGSANQIEYGEIKSWIKQINKTRFAGFNDWRLPTLDEAMSLMESQRNKMHHIDSVFDSKQNFAIWTSDRGFGGLWVVYFGVGWCNWASIGSCYIRAVRTEQSFQVQVKYDHLID